MSNTDRIGLLLDWWGVSESDVFRSVIRQIAENPVQGWDTWRDGAELLELIGKLRHSLFLGDFVDAEELAELLEQGALTMIQQHSLNAEELDKYVEAVEQWESGLGDGIVHAIRGAIKREFDEVWQVVEEIDSESTLDDHIEMLGRLGKFAGIAEIDIEQATSVTMARKAVVEELYSTAEPVSARSRTKFDAENFDDRAIANLFAPLVR